MIDSEPVRLAAASTRTVRATLVTSIMWHPDAGTKAIAVDVLSDDSGAKMPEPILFPAAQTQAPINRPSRVRNAPDALRLLDWTSLDAAPSSMDVTRMAGFGGRDGAARLAIV